MLEKQLGKQFGPIVVKVTMLFNLQMLIAPDGCGRGYKNFFIIDLFHFITRRLLEQGEAQVARYVLKLNLD